MNINPKDLTGAIRQLEQETNKETQEIHAKEEQLKILQAEEMKLKQEIPTLEKKLYDDKRKLSEDGIAESRLRPQINALKQDQVKKHSELSRVHDEYEKALQKSKIKLR